MNKKITTITRIVFGILLLAFGLSNLVNLFIKFMPAPQYQGPANLFMTGLMESGYILAILVFLKITVGICLLMNRFVPLALVLFAPISVNMVLFHVFLDPATIFPALLLFALNLYLLFANLESYKPLLKAKN